MLQSSNAGACRHLDCSIELHAPWRPCKSLATERLDTFNWQNHKHRVCARNEACSHKAQRLISSAYALKSVLHAREDNDALKFSIPEMSAAVSFSLPHSSRQDSSSPQELKCTCPWKWTTYARRKQTLVHTFLPEISESRCSCQSSA